MAKFPWQITEPMFPLRMEPVMVAEQPEYYQCPMMVAEQPEYYQCPMLVAEQPEYYQCPMLVAEQPEYYQCPMLVAEQPEYYQCLAHGVVHPWYSEPADVLFIDIHCVSCFGKADVISYLCDFVTS